MEKFDFNLPLDLTNINEILVSFNDEEVIFTKFKVYEEIMTLQFLENGGVQMVKESSFVVKFQNLYLEVLEVIYKDNKMTAKEFIDTIHRENLINHNFK